MVVELLRFGKSFCMDQHVVAMIANWQNSETMKHVLNFPSNTRVEFKSHDSSIQQRTAIEEQRREKAGQHHHHDKRHTGGTSKQAAEQSQS